MFNKLIAIASIILVVATLTGCNLQDASALTPTSIPSATYVPSATQTATATATDAPTDTPAATYVPSATQTATATATEDLTQWVKAVIAPYVTAVDVNGFPGQVVLGTTHALKIDSIKNQYLAIPATPGSSTTGWCLPGMNNCPPHTFKISVMVRQADAACTTIEMDISYRLMIRNNCGHESQVHIVLAFNSLPRPEESTVSDYATMFKNFDGGFLVSTMDPMDPIGQLKIDNTVVDFGHSCWFCLADTQGKLSPAPLNLDDPTMSRFGPETAADGSAQIPGLMVQSIPHPDKNPNWSVDMIMIVPQNGKAVAWTGVYKLLPATPTATPTATATP